MSLGTLESPLLTGGWSALGRVVEMVYWRNLFDAGSFNHPDDATLRGRGMFGGESGPALLADLAMLQPSCRLWTSAQWTRSRQVPEKAAAQI